MKFRVTFIHDSGDSFVKCITIHSFKGSRVYGFLVIIFFPPWEKGCGRPFGSQAKAKNYLPWGKCHINNEKAINGLLYIPKLVLHFLSQISSLSDPISNDDSGMLIDARGTAKDQGGEHNQ